MEKVISLSGPQMEEYIRRGKKHKAYDETVKIMNKLRVHADELMPEDLISRRRPSEMEDLLQYRKDIFEPITGGAISKVITSLAKIRKAPDWKMKYDENSIPARVVEEERLQAYLEENFPDFKSFEKWTFDVAMRQYLIDPNGLIAVLPKFYNVAENEYLQPYPVIYNSDQVYEYEDGNFAVIKSTDQATYTEKGNTFYNGEIWYCITAFKIQKWEQTSQAKEFTLTLDYIHELGFLPVFRMGGLFYKNMDSVSLWKSRINAMVPRLNEAAREYSDLQAEVVQHVHSEKWMWATQDCGHCHGTGYAVQVAGVVGTSNNQECPHCHGRGKIVSGSPFANIVLSPEMAGEKTVPMPPAGYIQKQVEIVSIQDKRVDDHIYKAYAAINMEFLAQTPLNQSGKAKEVDRDELNNFVNSIADDVVNIMRRIINITIEYRYRIIVPGKTERQSMAPSITVPDRFDLLSSDYLITDLEKAKNIPLNPVLVNEMMMGFAAKKFSDQPEVKAILQLLLELDPFPGLSEEDKITRLSNGGITKSDYIISCNIYQFVQQAIEEFEGKDREFIDLEFDDQKKVIQGYADKIAKSLEVKTSIMDGLNNPQDPNNPMNTQQCDTCGGTGKMPDGTMCPDCGGSGMVPMQKPMPKTKAMPAA